MKSVASEPSGPSAHGVSTEPRGERPMEPDSTLLGAGDVAGGDSVDDDDGDAGELERPPREPREPRGPGSGGDGRKDSVEKRADAIFTGSEPSKFLKKDELPSGSLVLLSQPWLKVSGVLVLNLPSDGSPLMRKHSLKFRKLHLVRK